MGRLLSKALLPVLVIIALSGGYLFYYYNSTTPVTQADLGKGYLLDKRLSKVPLQRENGEPFTVDNFKERWSLLFFGFTNCPDVCPTELLYLKGVIKNLPTELAKPEVYLVSLDPRRDTPEVLKDYVHFFNPEFKAIRLAKDDLNTFIKPFGTYYEFVIQRNGQNIIIKNSQPLPKNIQDYNIDHTTWIYLINPAGKIHAGFPSPHNQQEMISDLTQLISRY